MLTCPPDRLSTVLQILKISVFNKDASMKGMNEQCDIFSSRYSLLDGLILVYGMCFRGALDLQDSIGLSSFQLQGL